MTTPSRDAIEQHAYRLWQEEGCPDGHALDHWVQAEQTLTSPDSRPPDDRVIPGGHPPGMIAAEDSARRQREGARAPEMPRRGTTGRAAPEETGKPVWPQHASS